MNIIMDPPLQRLLACAILPCNVAFVSGEVPHANIEESVAGLPWWDTMEQVMLTRSGHLPPEVESAACWHKPQPPIPVPAFS